LPCFYRVGCDRIGSRADGHLAGHAGMGAIREADRHTIHFPAQQITGAVPMSMRSARRSHRPLDRRDNLQ
ncbi:hypothetical protein, partial [Mesorhizobium sp.]|uniref:hypothetical protein n=1 Tax=Mesorhizobium sp. TaxID=1871066 RepID=UPI0025C582A6